jgi:hypothetical protein
MQHIAKICIAYVYQTVNSHVNFILSVIIDKTVWLHMVLVVTIEVIPVITYVLHGSFSQ